MDFFSARAPSLVVLSSLVLAACGGGGGPGTTGFTGSGTAGSSGFFFGASGSSSSGTNSSIASTTSGASGTTTSNASSTSGSSSGTCSQQGQGCTPANPCDQGSYSCDPSTGALTCNDTGANPAANGQACGGTGMYCNNGLCTTCAQGTACTPTNVCDLGVISCQTGTPVCMDFNTPSSQQNGHLCGANMYCNNGQCGGSSTSSSSSGGSSGSGLWPTVPNGGSGVLANPNVVIVSFNGDANQSTYDAYGTWLATGGYLAAAPSQYGVNNGTSVAAHLTVAPPTGTNGNNQAFPNFFQSLFSSNAIPANTPTSIYVLLLPASWADLSTFCTHQGGYHTAYQDPSQGLVYYAIVPPCPNGGQVSELESTEIAISHEVVEAATDPYGQNGYQISDPNDPWFYLGGELGDLCASNTEYTYTDGTNYAQLIWSNQSVASNQIPCQPWPGTSIYYSLTGPTTMVAGRPGSQVPITLTGWASSNTSSQWYLNAQDGDFQIDFRTNPVLSAQSITQGGTVTVTLTIPQTAQVGQHGAAWIAAFDPNTSLGVGSTMVGVVVQ